MTKAEYPGNGGCPQRNSAEREEYAGARSIDRREISNERLAQAGYVSILNLYESLDLCG